jgi:hypothetical protein
VDLVWKKASSGVTGLNDLLGGGYPAYRVHLIEGAPGDVLPGLAAEQAQTLYPTIDPLTAKNCRLSSSEAGPSRRALGLTRRDR